MDRINFPPSRPEHHQKIAKMLGITLEELNIWRKETRQNAGVEVKSVTKLMFKFLVLMKEAKSISKKSYLV